MFLDNPTSRHFPVMAKGTRRALKSLDPPALGAQVFEMPRGASEVTTSLSYFLVSL